MGGQLRLQEKKKQLDVSCQFQFNIHKKIDKFVFAHRRLKRADKYSARRTPTRELVNPPPRRSTNVVRKKKTSIY